MLKLKYILFIITCFSNELDEYIQKFCKDNEINAIYSIFKVNNSTNQPEYLAKGRVNGYDESYSNKKNHGHFICSCTKQMTSLLILKLIEEGRFGLHDTVYKVLGKNYYLWRLNGGVPNWTKKVTIYQLLTHTSGLSDYLYDPYFIFQFFNHEMNEERYKVNVLRSASRLFQFFASHKSYSYINTNFFILSLVLERYYKEPLSTIFQNNIFGPLNMKNTFLLKIKKNHKISDLNLVKSYYFNPYEKDNYVLLLMRFFTAVDLLRNVVEVGLLNTLVEAEKLDEVLFFGDGGVVSNLEDMVIFLINLHKNRNFVSQDNYDLMYSKQEIVKGSLFKTKYDNVFYGFGTEIIEYKSQYAFGHPGHFAGYRCEAIYLKEQDVFILLFGNQAIMPRYQSDIGFYTKIDNKKYDIKYLLEALIVDYFIR